MTMPSSGSIGISTCPNGACSSIARVVANAASGSLCSLSIGAGLSAPHSMLDFYNYENFSAGQTSLSFGNGGQTINVTLYGSPSLSYSVSDDQTWITTAAPVTLNFSGVAQGVTVAANGGGARSGTVTLTPAFGAARTVTINQAAGITHSLSISPISATMGWLVGTCAISVTANAGNTWCARTANSWITLLTSSGTGNGTFCVRTLKNMGTTRYGTVCVTSSAPQKNLPVEQYGQYID